MTFCGRSAKKKLEGYITGIVFFLARLFLFFDFLKNKTFFLLCVYSISLKKET